MKIYLLTLCFSCSLLFISGCTSTKYDELIVQMQDYLDVNGEICLKYVENDERLIGRDKEKYKARHRTMQKTLNEFKQGN